MSTPGVNVRSSTSSSACAEIFLSTLEAQDLSFKWPQPLGFADLGDGTNVSVLFKGILGVRLFEESLITVCAGRLHTILHAGDLHVPGPGKGGKCVSHTRNIYHVNLYNFLSKLAKEICHQHPQLKVTCFRALCLV